MNGQEVFVAVVEVSLVGDLAVLEEDLTSLGRKLALKAGLEGDCPWVNRTVLLCAGCPAVPGWRTLQGADQGFEVEEATGASGPASVRRISPGWGNGELTLSSPVGDAYLWISASSTKQVVNGMVDAQVIWVGIEALALDSRDLVRDLRGGGFREMKSSLHRADVASLSFAEQRLIHDELLVDIQGRRRDVAVATLNSWHYGQIVDRVERRLSDSSNALRQRLDARSQRQQAKVGWVGFALSLLILLDLTLSLISTSFSGQSTMIGGDGGIFAFVRAQDGDQLLGVVAIVLVLISASLVLRGRK